MSTEDKFFAVIDELVEGIKEQFFLMDIDFDDKNCNIVFYEIAKLFLEKNRIDVLKKDASYFISECLREVDKDGMNDYSLFFDNIAILLELDFINLEDIELLKNRIALKLGINITNDNQNINTINPNQKKILLTNIC